MRNQIRGTLVCVCMVAVLAGCLSAARPRGPVDAFAFVAGANKSLAENAVGTINPGTDPQEIRVVLPPGTDLHGLVATLSLNREAVIAVISSGTRVVQENGVTPNDFSVPVTYVVEVAGDKKPWTYKVFVRGAETNAQLGILAVPPLAAMTPQFNPAVHAYVVQVPYAAASLQVRVGGQSRTLKSIAVDGMILPGVSATATVPFESVQEKTILIDCVAEDGVTRSQYTVTIQRAPPDTNSALAVLDLGDVPLSPAFAPQQMGYQATVLFAARQLVIHARPQSPVAKVTLLPAAADNAGSPMAFHGNLAARAGAVVDAPPEQSFSIVVQVTAEDGSIQQYLLEITRAPPDHNADLASLGVSAGALNPPFAPRIPQYSLFLPANAESVVITPVASSAVATVTLAGQPGVPLAGQGIAVPMTPGASSTVTFFVRAEDGFQRQYRVAVTRPQDANALLGLLQLGGAAMAPSFDPSVILYDVAVPANAASFSVQVGAQSRYAAVAIDGRPAGGAPVVLTIPPAGRRMVVVDVTAQNGTMVRYTLRVARESAVPTQPPAQPTQQPTGQPTQPPVHPAQPAGQPTQPPVQPAQPAGQPTQPPVQPAQPTLVMPPDSGRDHVVVMTRGLKLAPREAAEIAAAGDQPGQAARVTVRGYRTKAVITQYPARVEPAAQGKEMLINVNARSNGVALPRDRMVEIELSIPTRSGRFLYYTTAQPASGEVRITVPFLFYGENPSLTWPAPGTPVPVGHLVSVLAPGKERAMDKEDFPKNAKGAMVMSVQLLDASSGKVYGSAPVTSRAGSQGERQFMLDQPIQVPEGAVLKYVLSAAAKNGKVWTAQGSAQAWTTDPAYPAGFEPVTLAVSDDLAPPGR